MNLFSLHNPPVETFLTINLLQLFINELMQFILLLGSIDVLLLVHYKSHSHIEYDVLVSFLYEVVVYQVHQCNPCIPTSSNKYLANRVISHWVTIIDR